MTPDDHDDPTPEVHVGPMVRCVDGREVPADDCQRCWVEGYVMRRGQGVGCELGQKRRDANAKEATRSTVAMRCL